MSVSASIQTIAAHVRDVIKDIETGVVVDYNATVAFLKKEIAVLEGKLETGAKPDAAVAATNAAPAATATATQAAPAGSTVPASTDAAAK